MLLLHCNLWKFVLYGHTLLIGWRERKISGSPDEKIVDHNPEINGSEKHENSKTLIPRKGGKEVESNAGRSRKSRNFSRIYGSN